MTENANNVTEHIIGDVMTVNMRPASGDATEVLNVTLGLYPVILMEFDTTDMANPKMVLDVTSDADLSVVADTLADAATCIRHHLTVQEIFND